MELIFQILLLIGLQLCASLLPNTTALPTNSPLMLNNTSYNGTQIPLIDTTETTLIPTRSPTVKCLEMLIKDNINENYYISNNKVVPLFHNWLFKLTSYDSYIYRDSSGTLANLYFLDQSGWIMEIFDSTRNISQRIIYQSFITTAQLPIGEWHQWKAYGNKYSTIQLYMKCFDAYSPTAAIIIPDTTQEYMSREESSEGIDEDSLIFISFTFLLVIVLLVCILLIIVCAVCIFAKHHGFAPDSLHMRLRENSQNMTEEIELQNIRKEKAENENKGYTAVPLQQPNDRDSIHAVIAEQPNVNRGVSVPVGSLFQEDSSGNEDIEQNMVMMPGYNPHETVDVYRDSNDSEQSMERTKFHE